MALTTSGTSAGPRSVVRSTESWVASFPVVERLTGLGSASRAWVPGPLSATMNLFAAVHVTMLGARLVADLADATHAFLTPSTLVALPEGSLHGLTVVAAGDRLSPAAAVRVAAAGGIVHHYYGAAELSFVAWGPHALDLEPFPGVEVAVRDGEVWVRSPYVCDGYDGPPGPLRTAGDGWATVGDRGTLTDGRLHVTGRPGAVTTAGGTVVPAEVEALLEDAARGEVAVVGLPHPRLGTVLAVALTQPGDHLGLRALARERLDGASRPRLWFALDRLPTTDAGKPDRDALVSLLSSDGDGVTPLV